MNQNIGIALSGGGARGMMHIGVLHALETLGIRPCMLSGASSGSLVAALYSYGISPLEMLEMTHDPAFKKIFKLSFNILGLTQHKYLHEFLIKTIGKTRFEDLNIPLSICVTNIDEGRYEIIDSGDLLKPVIASCSIPILFKPVIIDGSSYVDGGLMNNLPIEPLLNHCDKVIAVGVNNHTYQEKADGIRSVGIRSFHLAVWNNMETRMNKCDIGLDFSDSCDAGMFDLNRSDELFQLGKNKVEKHAKDFQLLKEGKWNTKKIFR